MAPDSPAPLFFAAVIEGRIEPDIFNELPRLGKTLDEDTVRTRIKVGVPVHVHYVGSGDDMMVDRVILDED